MKNNVKYLLVSLLAISLVDCASSKEKVVQRYVVNGGFETSDLSGWTIEYGDAYTDDSVSSRDYFVFKNDNKNNQISINKTGNWYLSGQGFDLSYRHGRIGALRSNNFYLTNDGFVSMKLAGGALTKGKGVGAEYKNVQKVCYVGIYLAETDQMIARQTNEYFLEGTEDYIDANKYANGVYNTDNFFEYTIDLSKYANQEVYMRIVDNDQDVYYGYLSVDDIRIGEDALPQEEGQYFVKTRQYIEDVEAKDEYHIKNPDFEIGSLGGWTIVEGEAFSHDGVNAESTWWNENITYNRDGNYHYGHYNPTATGVLRSSTFKLGGKGYVSFKLGGCADQGLTFIRFMSVKDGEPVEVVRVSNAQYKNEQFPFVPMKMHLLNMVQYYIDLQEFVGENLYIEIIDNNASGDDLGCMTFDSFETYYTETPYWEDKEYYKIDIASAYEREPVNEYQPVNGTFETGDLTGWTTSWTTDTNRIGRISSKSYYWDNSSLLFNKRGTYFFSGEEDEGGTGYITSSAFTVGGVDMMTFRMSGGRDPLACHISIIDASTEEELLRFANYMFKDLDIAGLSRGGHLMDMIPYKADLSSIHGRQVKIRVVDNATSGWGLVCVDSFITYYETMDAVDSAALMNVDLISARDVPSTYQVPNGRFENGNLDGWTISDPEHPIMNISGDYTWWYEIFLFNRQGSFFLSGWAGGEANKGTITSSSFTVGGSGFITYRLGGGKNKNLCHIEFIDASTNEVLTSTYNQKFKDIEKTYYYLGYPTDLSKDGVYLANMAEYKVDLSAYLGRTIKIRLVDNAENDWGLLFADDFVTYYESADSIPSNYTLAEQF